MIHPARVVGLMGLVAASGCRTGEEQQPDYSPGQNQGDPATTGGSGGSGAPPPSFVSSGGAPASSPPSSPTGSPPSSNPECPTTGNAFDVIQARIFDAHDCSASACHGVAASGGLTLTSGASYESLVGV